MMRTGSTRRARWALAAGLLAVVAAVVLSWRPRPSGEADHKQGESRLSDHQPGQERAEGEETIVVVRDLESQHIKAASRVTGPDGTIKMRGDSKYGPLRVTLAYTASGRQDKVTIQAATGEYHPATQAGRFAGAVRVTTGLGVEVTSDSVDYRGAEQLARSEDVVQFKRKQLSGSSRGMVLAVSQGRLTLVSEVKLQIDDPERGPVDVTADSGTFEKADGQFELVGNVTVNQAGTVLTAERVVGSATLPDYTLTQLTATGDVRVRSTNMGAVRQMGVSGSAGTFVLRAKRLDMPLGSGGDATRRELRAGPEGVDLIWHTARGRKSPGVQKHLEANAATLVLDAAGQLEAVHAQKNVRLTELADKEQAGGASPAPGVIECGAGYMTLDPKTRQIKRGELQRDVVMTRGGMRAVAENGIYSESDLTLSGNPEVVDAATSARLTAETIQIGQGTKNGLIAAWGSVVHTFGRSKGSAEAPDKGALMTVSGNQMTYDEHKRSGVYNGDVLLRMGDDEISARQIQMRGGEGDLRLNAYYKVRSRFTLSAEGGGAKVVEGRANWLTYEEATGRLRYVRNVTFQQGDLSIQTAGRLVATLSKARTLQSLMTEGGSVTLVTGDRRATGTHLSYSPEQDALRLTGDPVTYEDSSGPGGRGLALTLYKGEDRMLLDGRDLQRTVTTIKKGLPQK